MQTTSDATSGSWWSVASAMLSAIVGAVALARGLPLMGAAFLTLAAVTALEAVDELVWRGSQRWVQTVRRLVSLLGVVLACWFLIDIVARWR